MRDIQAYKTAITALRSTKPRANDGPLDTEEQGASGAAPGAKRKAKPPRRADAQQEA